MVTWYRADHTDVGVCYQRVLDSSLDVLGPGGRVAVIFDQKKWTRSAGTGPGGAIDRVESTVDRFKTEDEVAGELATQLRGAFTDQVAIGSATSRKGGVGGKPICSGVVCL